MLRNIRDFKMRKAMRTINCRGMLKHLLTLQHRPKW